MIITTTEDGNELNIALKGRLDTTTAPELEDEIAKYTLDGKQLTLDITKLDYMSSAGLRVLLATYKTLTKKNGQMVILNPCETIMEVFKATGFTDIFTIKEM